MSDDSKAQISTLSLAEQREQDRKRYSDPAFNRWLDEGISDSGHTVWDAIGDTGAAWAGWENRPHYDATNAWAMTLTPAMIAAAAAVLRADLEPSAWPTDDEVREALQAALSTDDALRSAARDALRFLESLPDDLGRGSWNGFRVQAITALREALGDGA